MVTGGRYAQVVDAIQAAGKVGDEVVRLGSEVTRIGLSGDRVNVTIASGARLSAKAAVVTLPLGVLQHRRDELFVSPPIPPAQARAIDAVVMGNFTKIFVRWRGPRFWPDRGTQWIAAAPANDTDGLTPLEFHDLGALDSSLGATLMCYVVGNASAVWEGMSDPAAIAAVLARLHHVFGGGVRFPTPEFFYMSRHGLDPMSFGAYSTMTPGLTNRQFDQLIAPLYPRGHNRTKTGTAGVFFAGEHTCGALNGYAHGAYFSGLRAAQQALDLLGVTEPTANPRSILKPYRGQCGQDGHRFGA